MHIPTAADFHRTHGPAERLAWCARGIAPDGSHVDVCVPGDDDWTDEDPDPASIAVAADLLADADAVRDEAAAFVLGIVDTAKRPLVGTPQLVSLACHARQHRLLVDLNWESMPDALWVVDIQLHPTLGRRPNGMAVSGWGPRETPWPPEHVGFRASGDVS